MDEDKSKSTVFSVKSLEALLTLGTLGGAFSAGYIRGKAHQNGEVLPLLDDIAIKYSPIVAGGVVGKIVHSLGVYRDSKWTGETGLVGGLLSVPAGIAFAAAFETTGYLVGRFT